MWRFALEGFDQQAGALAAAIVDTSPAVHPALARVHAAALVSVFRLIVERTGHGVLDRTPPGVVADELAAVVDGVLDDLDRHFQHLPGAHPA